MIADRGKRNVAAALLTIIPCAAPAPARTQPVALPGIGAADRRQPVSVQTPPFAALLRVQTELGGRCTGFLVAPALAITAAHCLFLPRTGRFLQPGSVHVLSAYRAGAYRAHARVLGFRIAPAYRPQDEAATAGADRALLILDRPVGTAAQTLPLAAPPEATPAAPVTIRLAGYGRDREEVAVEAPDCALLGVGADAGGHRLLRHDCQATAGTSGAPLVWRRPDGRWAAIGVQVMARDGAAGGLAAAALDPGG